MASESENARPKGLLIPFDKFKLLNILDDAGFRKVVNAMAAYVERGTEPECFEPIEQLAFESMRQFLDENIKTYQRTVEANRENGRKGGRPRKAAKTDGFSEKPKETHGFLDKPMETEENPSKPKETHENQSTKYKVQSTTDTNVSDTSTVVVNRDSADSELAQIVQRYESVAGMFPRSAIEKLQSWREIFSTEMILLAIDRAAEANKRSWAYINGILTNWQKDGVRTLGDVAASDEARKSGQAQGRSGGPRRMADQKAKNSATDDYDEIFGELLGGST